MQLGRIWEESGNQPKSSLKAARKRLEAAREQLRSSREAAGKRLGSSPEVPLERPGSGIKIRFLRSSAIYCAEHVKM